MKSLQDLLSVPQEARDEAFENELLSLLPTSKVRVLLREPQLGPDGFSYLLAETVLDESSAEGFAQVAGWCAERGLGLVINPQKEPYPDYVFTYGMLWYFQQTGAFTGPLPPDRPGDYAIQDGQTLHVGTPSASFIPVNVRNNIKQFLIDQSVLRPEWGMLSVDAGKNFDLVFSLESLGTPPREEHDGILQAFAWFLPPHYGIGLVSSRVVSGLQPL